MSSAVGGMFYDLGSATVRLTALLLYERLDQRHRRVLRVLRQVADDCEMVLVGRHVALHALLQMVPLL